MTEDWKTGVSRAAGDQLVVITDIVMIMIMIRIMIVMIMIITMMIIMM